MGLRKGMTNNRKGREVGSKNVRTLEWEQFGKDFLAEAMPKLRETINEWYDSGDPDLQYKAGVLTTDVLEYFKPKMSRTEVSGVEGAPPLQIIISERI